MPPTVDPDTVFDDRVIYAQFIIGAPGAGKTTYCTAMHQFLRNLGREALIVDFDPAHEANVSPFVNLSLSEFITVDNVMEQFKLGPNGALMYCMEWLEDHLDSIIKARVAQLLVENPNCRYVLFDLPGQIELYSHSGSIQRILQAISGLKVKGDDEWGTGGGFGDDGDDDRREDGDDGVDFTTPSALTAPNPTTTINKKGKQQQQYTPLSHWNFRSVVVHLTDSVLCMEPHHYISSLLVSLSIMLNLQLPHVNVLTKVDLFGMRHEQEQKVQMHELQQLQQLQVLQAERKLAQTNGQNGPNTTQNGPNSKPQRKTNTPGHMNLPLALTNPFMSDIGLRGLSTAAPTPRLDYFDGGYLEAVVNQIDRELLYSVDNDEDDDGYGSYNGYGGYGDEEEEEEDEDQDDNNGDDGANAPKSPKPSRRVRRYLTSFAEINHGIVELIEDFSLVELTHLSVNDKHAMANVLSSVDRANGYTFQDIDLSTMQYNKLKDSMPQQGTQKRWGRERERLDQETNTNKIFILNSWNFILKQWIILIPKAEGWSQQWYFSIKHSIPNWGL